MPQRRGYSKLLIGLGLAAILALPEGCSAEEDGTQFFLAELDRVIAATTPAGSNSQDAPNSEQGIFSCRRAWQIETKQTWSDYTGSVEGLLAGYESSRQRDSSARYAKKLPGDSFTVSVEKLADGPPLRVRVTFVALAD